MFSYFWCRISWHVSIRSQKLFFWHKNGSVSIAYLRHNTSIFCELQSLLFAYPFYDMVTHISLFFTSSLILFRSNLVPFLSPCIVPQPITSLRISHQTPHRILRFCQSSSNYSPIFIAEIRENWRSKFKNMPYKGICKQRLLIVIKKSPN